jgi:hypothetical protein
MTYPDIPPPHKTFLLCLMPMFFSLLILHSLCGFTGVNTCRLRYQLKYSILPFLRHRYWLLAVFIFISFDHNTICCSYEATSNNMGLCVWYLNELSPARNAACFHETDSAVGTITANSVL